MVPLGSRIDVYVLRYDESDSVDVFFRASSFDNAVITGTKRALKLKLKVFHILDKDYHEIYRGSLSNY